MVALHPQFTRSNYKQFVTGGNKVGLSSTFCLCACYTHFCFVFLGFYFFKTAIFKTFPAAIMRPDCVRLKPNPAHCLALARLRATRRPLSGVKGSYFSVFSLECSRESCPFSQSAVRSTVFERQCFTSTANRCHYQEGT